MGNKKFLIQEYVDVGLKRREKFEYSATIVTSQINFDYEIRIHGPSPYRFTIHGAELKDFTDVVRRVIDANLDTFAGRP